MKSGPTSSPDRINLSFGLALAVAGVFLAGCIAIRTPSREQLDQMTVSQQGFWTLAGEQAGTQVRIHPCHDRIDILRLFDFDPTTHGIVPVFVSIRNGRDGALSYETAQMTLLSKGQKFRALSTSQLAEVLLDKYEIRAFSRADYDSFSGRLKQLILPDAHMGEGDEQWGVVFFKSVGVLDSTSARDVLMIGDARVNGRRTSLAFPLTAIP